MATRKRPGKGLGKPAGKKGTAGKRNGTGPRSKTGKCTK